MLGSEKRAMARWPSRGLEGPRGKHREGGGPEALDQLHVGQTSAPVDPGAGQAVLVEHLPVEAGARVPVELHPRPGQHLREPREPAWPPDVPEHDPAPRLQHLARRHLRAAQHQGRVDERRDEGEGEAELPLVRVAELRRDRQPQGRPGQQLREERVGDAGLLHVPVVHHPGAQRRTGEPLDRQGGACVVGAERDRQDPAHRDPGEEPAHLPLRRLGRRSGLGEARTPGAELLAGVVVVAGADGDDPLAVREEPLEEHPGAVPVVHLGVRDQHVHGAARVPGNPPPAPRALAPAGPPALHGPAAHPFPSFPLPGRETYSKLLGRARRAGRRGAPEDPACESPSWS